MNISKPVCFVSGLGVAALIYSLSAVAAQPHMDNALSALRNARTELNQAEANKGGHRVRAIQLVDSAIAEVKSGMAYADVH